MTLHALDRLVTRERVRTVTVALLAAYAIGAVVWLALMKGDLDLRGQPLGADFIIFYSASTLALKGHAIAAYVPAAMLKVEGMVAAGSRGIYLWCYPPAFQLLIAPLALAPYRLALLGFNAAGFALYLGMTRLMGKGGYALLLAAAFPAVFQNAMQGQTGFLTASLLGAGLLLMERRPWVAGAILGLLVVKPHLAILLPVLTLGTGRWRTILGAAASGLALVGASVLAFGIDPWRAFLDTLPLVSHALAAGALPLNKAPTLFVMMIELGAPIPLAQALQGVIAIGAAGATLIAWRRPGPWPMKAGLAVLGTLIAIPYAFDYDLMLLAIPIGVCAAASVKAGTTHGRFGLALLYFAPLLVTPLWALAHVQLVPLLIVFGYGVLWRRLGRQDAPQFAHDPATPHQSPQPA